MNAAAARSSEFGTGLRTRIERVSGLQSRPPCRSSRDLVRLCAGKTAEGSALVPRPAGLEPAVRGTRGAFAA